MVSASEIDRSFGKFLEERGVWIDPTIKRGEVTITPEVGFMLDLVGFFGSCDKAFFGGGVEPRVFLETRCEYYCGIQSGLREFDEKSRARLLNIICARYLYHKDFYREGNTACGSLGLAIEKKALAEILIGCLDSQKLEELGIIPTQIGEPEEVGI